MLSHASSPSWTARAIAAGSTDQRVRPDPRDVDEVGDPRVGSRRADERGHEVEVVVVDEERRTGRAVELLDRGRGERRVHRHVAVAPAAGRDRRRGRASDPRGRAGRTTAPGSRPRRRTARYASGSCATRRSRNARAGRRTARPAARRRRARGSASPIALATHVTSWRSTSGRSAVTSPPAPRIASRLPSAARRKPTGSAVRDDDEPASVRLTTALIRRRRSPSVTSTVIRSVPPRSTVNGDRLTRQQPRRHDPRDVLGARHRRVADRDDQVAAERHVEAVERLGARPAAQAGACRQASRPRRG